MSEAHLAVYLHDHRAGATAAVELLEHLERLHPDSALARFASDLRAEVLADVRELEGLMGRAGIGPSLPRNAMAWLAEKLAELKIRADDPLDGKLQLLETLEAIAVGIDGKRALWLALQDIGDRVPALTGLDYGRLIQRAETQRHSVEAQRLAAARAALETAVPKM